MQVTKDLHCDGTLSFSTDKGAVAQFANFGTKDGSTRKNCPYPITVKANAQYRVVRTRTQQSNGKPIWQFQAAIVATSMIPCGGEVFVMAPKTFSSE